MLLDICASFEGQRLTRLLAALKPKKKVPFRRPQSP